MVQKIVLHHPKNLATMGSVRKAPLLAPFVLLAAVAHADDAFLTYSGAPRLLSRHPTIRMVSESVTIDVIEQGYRVEATFAFQNEGRACAVRMGFPDRINSGDVTFAEQREAAVQSGKPLPIYQGLKDFASSVDGKRVATQLQADGKGMRSWHTKIVRFARGQAHKVRVRYLADGGSATNSGGGSIRELSYILHTGASWHGPIEYAAVLVRFAPGALAGPVWRMATEKLRGTQPFELTDLGRRPKGTVFWQGPTLPRRTSSTLLFVRRDFEPRQRDDVDLWFGFPHRFKGE